MSETKTDEALALLYDECDHYLDAVLAVRAEIRQSRAQRAAVLAIHTRRDTGGQAACGHCSIVGRRGDVPVQLAVTLWPCPTVQALGGES